MKVFDFVGICLFTKGFVSEGILPEGIFSDSQLFFLFVALDFSSNFDFSNQLQKTLWKTNFSESGEKMHFCRNFIFRSHLLFPRHELLDF